jgi:cytochrome o ubiquinol oxidase subunit II
LQRRSVAANGDAFMSHAAGRLHRALAAGLAGAALSGCSGGVLTPAGPVGSAERLILFDSLAIMLAIVVPTILATLAFAWWWRAGNAKAVRRPDFAYSGRVELLVWSIPALTILFLGGIAWISSHELDPGKPLASAQGVKPLEVQVVSLDWKWLFIYPQQGVASINRLVIPTGAPVHFTLTSATVMNAFMAPSLGSQIYTMSGMATQLNLQADRPGRYEGLSAHLSGDGFSDMRFFVDAVPPAGFAAWVNGARAAGPALDEAAYRGLLKQSVPKGPYTYRDVRPGLFDAVVRLDLPPGEGPPAGTPHPVAPSANGS